MYHEITYKEIARRRRWRIIYAVVLVVLAVNVVIALWASQAATRGQGAVAVRDAIVDAAAQCCAVEGSYPSSLKHLESHYGLVINHNDYVINYEWLADNIPPSVAVTAR